MAYKKATNEAPKEVSKVNDDIEQVVTIKEEVAEPEELNLEKKVTIKNIAGWEVGFARIEGIGDIRITAEANIKLARSEIIQQVQNGNRLFTGVAGDGDHATLFIDDVATRRELGFEDQKIFTDDLVKELFSISDLKTFKEELCDRIQTRAEKYAIVKAITKLKLNDYAKIRAIEQYTGYNVN